MYEQTSKSNWGKWGIAPTKLATTQLMYEAIKIYFTRYWLVLRLYNKKLQSTINKHKYLYEYIQYFPE